MAAGLYLLMSCQFNHINGYGGRYVAECIPFPYINNYNIGLPDIYKRYFNSILIKRFKFMDYSMKKRKSIILTE